MLSEDILKELYDTDKMSMMDISKQLNCSLHKVNYWMDKYGIRRRSISNAVYQHCNPNGDPFKIKKITTIEEAKLLGLGIGLYWGEGNKLNRHSVRLGNTDPGIIKTFTRFLIEICLIDTNKLRYGLQIFSDTDPEKALIFWINELNVDRSKFNRVIVTPARSIGTYKK